MTVYTAIPQDDSNLDVQVTEAPDLVEINIQPAGFTGVTAADVSSVNGQTGVVVLDTDDIDEGDTNLYHTEERVQAIIDGNDLASETYVDTAKADAISAANAYTLNQIGMLDIPASTTDLAEGSNLYYTDARVQTVIDTNTADFATESYVDTAEADAIGAANLYTDGRETAITTAYESYADAGDTNILSQANSYTDTAISNLIDSAPATLDTLNELAAALGDDPNFATTITNSIATKLASADFNSTADTWLTGKTTNDLTEGDNLYYTEARVDANFATKESADLAYDNTDSTLTASNVKAAIDQLDLNKVSHSEMIGTLVIYPTDTASGISTYYLAVDSITDAEYNDTPVDITTPSITSEDPDNPLLVGAVISEAGIINGNPGRITVHTVGNIRQVSGNRSAAFRFEMLHRDSGGTETSMGMSGYTNEITTNEYEEFAADCLLSTPVTFTETDRLVVKYYGYKTSSGGGADPVYQFQFGGDSPVRTNLPVPVNVLAKTQTAAEVPTDTSNFDGILSGSDTTVQAALETIDGISLFSGDYADLTNKPTIPAEYTDADVDAHLNTSGATTDQVLSWTGSDYAWVDQSGGGGGASSLDDLTDVSIVSVSDGDMLIYNGTAGEWQNTNLGISVTPIVTMDSEFYAGLTATATITNYNTYDDPNFWAQVKDSGGTVVVTNSEITDNNDGTISFVTPSVGTDYTLEVRVQDFGDVASEIATQNFNSIATPTHRYYRITFKNATSYNMIDRVQFYTGSNQTGTLYPTSAMTGYTTPSPYVASADKSQSGYDAWEAFDNAVTGIGGSWWNLGSSSYANSWLQIDMGASVQINSFRLNPVASGGYVNTAGWYIWSSDTGAFAGEEVLRAEIDYISGTYEYTVG